MHLALTIDSVPAPGDHLLFQLGDTTCGLPLCTLSEVIRLREITPVAHMPAFLMGLARGRGVRVIDLRSKFGWEAGFTDDTCLLIVPLVAPMDGAKELGLVVDRVECRICLAASDIAAAPEFGSPIDARYLIGITVIQGRNVLFLRPDAFGASGEERRALKNPKAKPDSSVISLCQGS
jgi:purine-binding chemotaxis protein CheW